MSVTRKHVRDLAVLAGLRFTAEEEDAMVADLSRMVEYVEQLRALDTASVPPMSHALDLATRFRADVASPRISRDEAMASAPSSDGEYFRVPRVIE